MDYNGIIPLFKPKGLTSHDCVFKIRKLLKMKKVGHTGTLDPDVTGVLPICLGKATKVAEYMSDYPKTYVAEVTLGFSTTTEDASGDIVENKKVKEPFSKKELEAVLETFKGTIIQVPPMFSAVKVNGKRLYEYARAGIEVERPQREVKIYSLQMNGDPIFENDKIRFSFEVHCSKGTYIRTLAVDIGNALGYPAHMSYLQRIASGPFTLSNCVTFEEIEEKLATGSLDSIIAPLERAIAHVKKVMVPNELEQKIIHGSVLPKIMGVEEKRFSIYNERGECLAIYQDHPTKPGLMKPEKMFS